MQWFREKFGAAIVSVIIGLIALVFIFYGVFSPKGGAGSPSVAGTVNGEAIGMREYQQALNQKLEMFKSMTGGKVSDEQLRAFHVQESVIRELAQRKLLVQEAHRQGLEASDEEVKQAILEIPAFQKDGKFNLVSYKQMIEASPYGSTGSFERLVRDDLSAQRWSEYFKRRVQVSDEEARREYLVSRDKRNVKYVLLTTENGRKGVEVKPEDIKKYLADSTKMNLVKSQFESKAKTEYKGKTLESVQDSIARELIAGEKVSDIQKVNDKLAEQVQGMLTADKASDAKVNAILKVYGAEVKSTGAFNRQTPYIPGIGDAKELVNDAFATKSPIDPAQGGHAKKYASAAWTLVALVTEVQHADPAKFATEREDLIKQIAYRKQRELYEGWLRKLTEKAKIEINPSIAGTAPDTSET